MHDILVDFNFLCPIMDIFNTNRDGNIEGSYDFCPIYEDEINSHNKMLSIQKVIYRRLKIKNNQHLGCYNKNNDLSSSFPDVLSVHIIFNAMPITVTGAER